ncbi:outer membrane protein assembly factor BamD [Lunatimonas lonarensis]|nr:molecular chaperone DnaJ [Lunatimonas lonarensis]
MKQPIQGFRPKMLLLMLSFFSVQLLYAQAGPNLGTTARTMNQAIQAMEEGKFETANGLFRQIVQSNVPIPPEMPFFFAKTLYELGQYSNSENFLQKYLDLNGFSGEHYQQAKALQEKLKIPLSQIKECSLCDRLGYRLHTCETCLGERVIEQDCGLCKLTGIVGCSRCAGKGVVTKKNVFNIVEYYDCERCETTGRLTCPRCEGTKVEHGDCNTCKGTGQITSSNLCDHTKNDGLTYSQSIRTSFRIIGH